MEDLITRINNLRKEIVRGILPHIRTEVDNLIKNKETSIPQIERTLDTLLDFAFLGYGAEEFQRLNAYYQTVHPEYSEAYSRLFKEYFGEDI